MDARERALARARVSAFLTAPSWVRSPYTGAQAEQILALVLDTKACAAETQHSILPSHMMVCYREQGHDGSHFAEGGYAWDLTDEELEARHDAQVDRDIEAHDRMLDDTLEDR